MRRNEMPCRLRCIYGLRMAGNLVLDTEVLQQLGAWQGIERLIPRASPGCNCLMGLCPGMMLVGQLFS